METKMTMEIETEGVTVFGIIQDEYGKYDILPVNTSQSNLSLLQAQSLHDISITCWRSEYPDILFKLLVGIDVFKERIEAEAAYYNTRELG